MSTEHVSTTLTEKYGLYVNWKHVRRQVRTHGKHVSVALQQFARFSQGSAQVVFAGEMRNPITFKSHIHLSISSVSTCLFNFTEVQIPFDECCYTNASFSYEEYIYRLIFTCL